LSFVLNDTFFLLAHIMFNGHFESV
jgi:hypothetical protein